MLGSRTRLPAGACCIILLSCVLALGALSGCETKVTRESFERVQVGMAMSEVEHLLGGSGTEDSSPAGLEISGAGAASTKNAPKDRTYLWQGDGVTIVIVFQNGKVVQKTLK